MTLGQACYDAAPGPLAWERLSAGARVHWELRARAVVRELLRIQKHRGDTLWRQW